MLVVIRFDGVSQNFYLLSLHQNPDQDEKIYSATCIPRTDLCLKRVPQPFGKIQYIAADINDSCVRTARAIVVK